jgi:hypothetical protein
MMGSESIQNPNMNQSHVFLGIKRKYWFIGLAVLLIICLAIAAIIALIYLNNSGLTVADPIPGLTPKDSALSISMDLIKAQAGEFMDVAQVFQQMADFYPDLSLMDALDQYMLDEMGMTFTKDVLPWVGRYAGLIVPKIDTNDIEGSETVLIISARNKSKADEFLQKFVNYLEDRSGDLFETIEMDGITFYSNSVTGRDTTVGRSDNLLFLGTSIQVIQEIINVKEADSISSLNTYKNILNELPDDSYGKLFLNLTDNQVLTNLILNEVDIPVLLSTTISNLNMPDLLGVAFSITNDGLLMDTAATVDQDQMTGFQKDSFQVSYKRSDLDQLMPYDSFLYFSTNGTLPPARYFSGNGPMNNSDIQESLSLLENQYGIDINQIANALTGEIGLVVGPANSGLIPLLQNTNLGLTLIAGTDNEAVLNTQVQNAFDGFLNDFMGNLTGGINIPFLDLFLQSMKQPVTYGSFDLQEFSMGSLFSSTGLFVYGADNGYFVFGSSPDVISESMEGGQNLADNSKYKDTWNSFPSSSTPYIYIDLVGLVKFIDQSDPTVFINEYSEIPNMITKVPVLAVTRQDPSNYVFRSTLILFVDKDQK